LAKVNYVAIPITPSERDVESTFEYAKMLLAQIRDGADFAEIARNSSEDPGSATQGGELGDYTPHGRWVAEFDSAAFALDSGKISEPVRSQFGYHIIQSLGKRIENDEEQVKARHILLVVSATAETIDSLEAILNEVKSAVDNGKSFDEAAKAKNLTPQNSNWFKRGGEVAELGHISGLSSYAFFNPLRPKDDSKTSEVLQNTKWVALFEKSANLAAGSRSEEFAKTKIEQSLKSKAKAEAVASYLRENMSKLAGITILDSASKQILEKATIDSLTISFEGYLPGLGYANPEVYKALSTAKENEWSGPFTSGQNAVLIKVLSKKTPSNESIESAVRDELSMNWQYGSFSVYGEYMRNLEAGANVVNNLDLYYKE